MPYTLNGNCVVKKDTGETVKCFETRAAAVAHLRALYANVPEADWSNEVKAILKPIEREQLPSVWVRAHPYGKPTMKDVHGEYFDARTNFFDDGKLLSVVPVSYYHNHDDNGAPIGEPTAIGVTSGRKYQGDGRWDRVQFFDNVSDDIRARIQSAIEHGTLRASPTVVPDFHSVANDGHISHWLTGSIAVFDAQGRRQPANPRAIAALTPTQLKALYKAAHLEFPENVMKSSGNPNHDEQGRFASGDSRTSQDDSENIYDDDDLRTSIKAALPKASLVRLNTLADKKNLTVTDLRDTQKGLAIVSGNPQQAYDYAKWQANQEWEDKNFKQNWQKISNEIRLQWSNVKDTNFSEYRTRRNEMKAVTMNKDDWMKKARDAWRAFQKAVGMSDANETDDDDDDDEMKADKPPQAADKDAWEELFSEDDDAAENKDDDGNDDDEPENSDAKSGKQASQEKKREGDMADSKQQQTADEIRLEYDNKMKAILDSNRAMQRELDETKLTAWFDEQLREGKVMPAERAEIVEMALQLKADDAATHPTMKSADGAAVTRLAVFQNTIEARTPRVNVNGDANGMKFAGFDNQTQPRSANDVTPERVKELLSQTDMGQNILAARKNGSN